MQMTEISPSRWALSMCTIHFSNRKTPNISPGLIQGHRRYLFGLYRGAGVDTGNRNCYWSFSNQIFVSQEKNGKWKSIAFSVSVNFLLLENRKIIKCPSCHDLGPLALFKSLNTLGKLLFWGTGGGELAYIWNEICVSMGRDYIPSFMLFSLFHVAPLFQFLEF